MTNDELENFRAQCLSSYSPMGRARDPGNMAGSNRDEAPSRLRTNHRSASFVHLNVCNVTNVM